MREKRWCVDESRERKREREKERKRERKREKERRSVSLMGEEGMCVE